MQSLADASLRRARIRLGIALAVIAVLLLYLKLEDVKPSERRQAD